VKPGSGYKNYIQNHMKDGPLVKLNTWRSWTCGYAGSSSAVKPMSLLWIPLQWLHT
jgi:hypothetical protein